MFDSREMRSRTARSKNKNSNNNNNSSDEPLPIASLRLLAPPLRLVSAAMWKVMQQRDAMHYGKLEEFVTSVSETVPGLLSYRHQAKLSVGLRARLILEQLRMAQTSDPELILPQLERLRAPALHNNKENRNDKKVKLAVKNFHTLVQTLLEKPAEREQFFKEEFVSQYGPQYDSALEKLLWEFLTRLDELLPVPDLTQTVSWLTTAPAVLEECARSASQPQLLRTLLQHEKCLGHLDSAASVPSSTGDSILSSLSLTLSGKVRDSDQSGFTGSTPGPNIIPSPTSTTGKLNKTQARGTAAHIPLVIGSISPADIPQAAGSSNSHVDSDDGDEVDSEDSVYTRVRSRSCRKSASLQKVPEEQCVGKMLMTVINQTPTPTSSEVEEEDEILIRKITRSGGKSGAKDNRGSRSSDKKPDLGQKRKKKNSSKTSGRTSKDAKPQEEKVQHADLASCMKPLRVIVPRLDVRACTQTVFLNTSTEKERSTTSSEQSATEDVSAVGAGNRKRKLSFFKTPEKNPSSSSNDERVYVGSPCIPKLTPLRMENADTASPVPHTTDDVIVDSEDEAAEKVKGRLFTKRYCKTKNDTFIPTLHEFWTPPFFRRDLLSPGNSCR